MPDPHGTITWTELLTPDAEAAKAFYAALCGWGFDTMPLAGGEGDYVLAIKDGAPVAGILDTTLLDAPGELAPGWFNYIAVDDVDAAARDSIAAGGTLVRAPYDIPDVGRVAIVADPGGAAIGLIRGTGDR